MKIRLPSRTIVSLISILLYLLVISNINLYVHSNNDGNFQTGISIGFERRTSGYTTFQFTYPAGIFYNPNRPDASTLWIMKDQYQLASSIHLGWKTDATPREVKFLYYYGYAKETWVSPYENELQLVDTEPYGFVDNNVPYSESFSFTIGDSYGVEEAGLSVGSEVSYGVSVNVNPGIWISYSVPYEQNGLLDEKINKIIDSYTDGAKDAYTVKLAETGWHLRAIGNITIEPYNSKEIPSLTNEFIVRLAVNNQYAKWDDNYFHDRLMIVVVGIAKYVDDDWPGRGKAVVAITYILGDNSQVQGDDCYLWFIATK